MTNLIIILVSVLLGSIGQVILKIGANKLGSLSFGLHTIFYDLVRIMKTPEIMLGLVFFGSSFLLWVKVLTKSELSYAYPMVSLGYINVIILSYFLFNESFTTMKVIGNIFIIIGVILLNK
ncbi:EamA family transporter [Anaerobacillus sp. MEB173]|uniref:EamA family transporter n=1 Tax=Anaerobacillus sp. MEB173 TaxID=3383345 RepID=UPI003F8FF888